MSQLHISHTVTPDGWQPTKTSFNRWSVNTLGRLHDPREWPEGTEQEIGRGKPEGEGPESEDEL